MEKLNFFIEDKSSSSFTLILENLINDNFIDSYFSFPISSYQGV